MQIDILTTESAFDGLRVDWERLTAASTTYGIFNTWVCNRTWWQHHNHLGKLCIFVARDDRRVVGIAPLYRKHTKRLGLLKLDTLLFIGRGASTTPDDLDLLVENENSQAITRHLLDAILSKKFLQRLYLQDVPNDSDTLTLLNQKLTDAHTTRAHKPYVELSEPSPRLITTLASDWESYLAGKSRNFRKQVKRRHNRLQRSGEFLYTRCQSQTQIDDAFKSLKKLHQLRWTTKSGQQSGSFSDPHYLNYHHALMHQLAKQDQLWLITLTLNEEIVGVEYAFSHNGRLSLFQTGFNPEFTELAPGHLMMTHLIWLAINDGISELDLLKGDYSYKESYAEIPVFSRDMDVVFAPLAGHLLRLKRGLDKLRNRR